MTALTWMSPSTDPAPTDGRPLILLLAQFEVYAARWNGEYWVETNWGGVVFDEETAASRIIGWIPFPALGDPYPWPLQITEGARRSRHMAAAWRAINAGDPEPESET